METLRMILAWPVLAAVIIFVIWQFLMWLGRVQLRIDRMEFDQAFALLKMCVECAEQNEESFRFIAERFNDLDRYQDKDDESLEKLRDDFEYKFRAYMEPKVRLN